MREAFEKQLEVKRVETLYGQTYPALAANLLTAVVFSLVLSLNGYTTVAAYWLIVLCLVIGARYQSLRSFRVQDDSTLDPEIWFRRYGLGIGAGGCLWGFIGAYSVLVPSLAVVFFTVAVLVGMVGGSVATCAVSVPIFLTFTLPALLPVIGTLMISGESEKLAISILLLVYIAVVTRSVVQIQRVITQSIYHRYENKRLLGELEQEKQQIQDSENQLRAAFDELEVTHLALVEQKSLVKEKISEVKVLQGLLSICAECKKISNDEGEWSHLETFISARSEAEFSHGLCPDCFETYRGQTGQAEVP